MKHTASHSVLAHSASALLLATAALCACNDTQTIALELAKTARSPSDPSLIIASGVHTCAQSIDGVPYCWGGNDSGQLGDGTFEMRSHPSIVPGEREVRQLAANADTTCVLHGDGTVACFGSNEQCVLGTLGNATVTRPAAPREAIDVATRATTVPNIVDATQISVNDVSACALHANGTVTCWGRSDTHPGTAPADLHCDQTFADVHALSDVVQLRGDGQTTCALRNDGTVWCWHGVYASDPLSSIGTLNPPPQQVVGISGARQIALGAIGDAFTVCALSSEGEVSCAGDNSMGQLGVGDFVAHTGVVGVSGLARATRVFASGARQCAIGADRRLYCWGGEYFSDPNQQATLGPQRCPIGAGATLPCRTSPAAVDGITNVIDAAVGGVYTCALSDDGSVRCFGVAAYGAFGDGTTDQRLAGATLVRF
jgi:alpha-tubulin suppressor-like RCC1 family protein